MVRTDCGEAFPVRSGDRSAVAGGAGVVEPGDPVDGEVTGEIGWVDQQRHRLGVLVVGDVGGRCRRDGVHGPGVDLGVAQVVGGGGAAPAGVEVSTEGPRPPLEASAVMTGCGKQGEPIWSTRPIWACSVLPQARR